MARTLKKIKRKKKKNSRKRKYQTGGSVENLPYTPEKIKPPPPPPLDAPIKPKERPSLILNNVGRIGEVSANGTIYKFDDNSSQTVKCIMKTSQNAFSDNLLYEYLVGKYLNSLNKYDCFVYTYDLYLLKDNSLTKLQSLDDNTKNANLQGKDIDYPVIELYFGNDHVFGNDLKKLTKYNNYVDQELEHHMCNKNTHFALVQEYIEDGKNFLSYFVGKENTGKIKYKSLEFYLILYQIYKPLCELKNEFSHNDLHMNNIMIKELTEDKKKTIEIIEINNEIYTCKYQPYIIDYGRCFFKNGLDNSKDSKKIWDSINEELSNLKDITRQQYFNSLAQCGMKQIPYNYKPDIRLYNTLFTNTNLTNLDDILNAIVKGIKNPDETSNKRKFLNIDPNEPPPIPIKN